MSRSHKGFGMEVGNPSMGLIFNISKNIEQMETMRSLSSSPLTIV